MTKTRNLEVRPATPLVGSLHLTEDVAIYFLPSLVQNMKHLFSLLRLCTQTASDLLRRAREKTVHSHRRTHMEGTIQWNPGGASAESHAPPHPGQSLSGGARKGGGAASTRSRRPCPWGRPAARSIKCTLWPGHPARGMGHSGVCELEHQEKTGKGWGV